MKKILCMMCLALLVGCIFDNDEKASSRKKMWWSVEVSGVAQCGYFENQQCRFVQVGNYLPQSSYVDEWTDEVHLRDVEGSYSVKSTLRSRLVEIHAFTERYGVGLNAIADLDSVKTVNVNYLTSMAAPLILYHIMHGDSYNEARLKANKAVLLALTMPEDLTDFENYSLYGTGNGDAMLAAVSIVMGRASESYNFELDTLTNEFVEKDAFYHLAKIAKAILFEDDSADSIRRAIEEFAPGGKVPRFEKYLNVLARYAGGLICDKSHDKELRYIGHVIICSDSAWRPASKDDFSTEDIFNPRIQYGTLKDSRDGKTYKTVDINGYTWMAENLKYADSATSENLKGQSWCYENDESNCELYGRLYSWSAAMDLPTSYLDSFADYSEQHRGICPEGWHIPFYEFEDMPKSGYTSSFMSLGLNEYGFSMLLGGYGTYYDFDGYDSYYEEDSGDEENSKEMKFVDMDSRAGIWSARQTSQSTAYVYYIESYDEIVSNPMGDEYDAYSVRCVKDYEPKD